MTAWRNRRDELRDAERNVQDLAQEVSTQHVDAAAHAAQNYLQSPVPCQCTIFETCAECRANPR
jgi:hypothetical protein